MEDEEIIALLFNRDERGLFHRINPVLNCQVPRTIPQTPYPALRHDSIPHGLAPGSGIFLPCRQTGTQEPVAGCSPRPKCL